MKWQIKSKIDMIREQERVSTKEIELNEMEEQLEIIERKVEVLNIDVIKS